VEGSTRENWNASRGRGRGCAGDAPSGKVWCRACWYCRSQSAAGCALKLRGRLVAMRTDRTSGNTSARVLLSNTRTTSEPVRDGSIICACAGHEHHNQATAWSLGGVWKTHNWRQPGGAAAREEAAATNRRTTCVVVYDAPCQRVCVHTCGAYLLKWLLCVHNTDSSFRLQSRFSSVPQLTRGSTDSKNWEALGQQLVLAFVEVRAGVLQ
jgi:hypothetical protein